MDTIHTIPPEELPLWMRRARQSIDWGILLTMLLSLLAAWPFLLQDGIPPMSAAQNHAFQAADYAESLREGQLYPRWAAGATLGYGAPIYNYAEPAHPYLTAAVSLLFTDGNITQAIRLLAAASLFMAGVMTYVFVVRVSGASAGILAATLLVYSPHVGLNTPILAGDYPHLLTLALLPALLWSVMRITERQHPLDFVTLAGLGASLALNDLQAVPVAIGLGTLVLVGQLLRDNPVRRAGNVILAGLTAAALSAFYWLPAFVERDVVTWIDAPYMPRQTTLTLGGLFQPLPQTDLNALSPLPLHSLGAALIVLLPISALILVAVFRFDHNRRAYQHPAFMHLLLLGAGAVIIGIGIIAMPENTALLGPATLAFAIGASGLMYVRDIIPEELRRLVLPAAVIIAIGSASPIWLPPRGGEITPDYSLYEQIIYEQNGYGVAVLPPGEIIPTTVDQPIANNDLIDGYRNEQPIRIPNLRLTGEKRASYLSDTRHIDRYLIDARDGVTFDILRAYAPGWKATLNGNPVPVEINPATQLMQITMPTASNAEFVLYYGSTPIRQIAWGISLLTLMTLGLITGYRLLRMEDNDRLDDLTYLTVPEARLLTIVGASFLLVLMVFAIPSAPLSLYPRPGYQLDDFVGVRATSSNGMEVIGYRRTDQDDESLTVAVAWRTLRPQEANYYVRATIESAQQGVYWAQTEPQFVGNVPSIPWTPYQYVIDTYTLSTTSLIPGTYQIGLRIYSCLIECNNRIAQTFTDADGVALGETIYLPLEIVIP